MNPIREGDTVRIDLCYFVRERDAGNGVIGTVTKITSPYGSRPTTYLVVDGNGREFTASRVSRVYATAPTGSPEIPKTVDDDKVTALRIARELAGREASLDDVFRVAEYVQTPKPTTLGAAQVRVSPGVPLIDLAADRTKFYDGLSTGGVYVERDRSNDDDLVYISGGHATIAQAKEIVDYLQAAIRVGETEGTGPEPRPISPF